MKDDVKTMNELLIQGTAVIEVRRDITRVSIPDFVTSINELVFYDCEALTEVNIPNSVVSVGKRAFSRCTSLKYISLPNSITSIGSSAFRWCTSLKEIIIPNSITSILENTFANCTSLKSVTIPDSVKTIGKSAFTYCTSLETINLPNSITSMGDFVFYQCQALNQIVIPNSVVSIGREMFSCCTSLKDVSIPNSVKSIADKAFYNCVSLNRIVIPSSVTHIGSGAFSGCNNLEYIELNIANNDVIYNDLWLFLIYDAELEKTENGYLMKLYFKGLNHPIDKSKQINPLLFHYFIEFFDDEKKRKILNKIDNSFAKYIQLQDNEKMKNGEPVDYSKIFDYNYKSLNNLSNIISNKEFENSYMQKNNFYKFCENIGVLNPKPVTIKSVSKSGKEKIETIDYAQKAREFIKDRIMDGSFDPSESYAMFDKMKPLGFKQGFADFFLDKNNFQELMAAEEKHQGFIARCYNDFESVQFAHTNNRGSQRRLAPTVEFFEAYFATNKFSGITDETREIASTISPYFSRQNSFDKAIKIYNERQENKIPDNILSEELKEDTVFEKVDKLIEVVQSTSIDTLSTLTDLSNKKFTFELLKKSDPLNFILGKLCSCCAHIEGAGNGIMRASIVHPDVQNIVIRDHTGKIVAKSTLYVNRKEGYGVCNNVEVNNDLNNDDKNLIYKKYKKAIVAFATKYNEEFPNNPLKIINVGMHLNDLQPQIIQNDKNSITLYNALNYEDFAFDGSNYSGDSAKEQYTLWQIDELKNDLGV